MVRHFHYLLLFAVLNGLLVSSAQVRVNAAQNCDLHADYTRFAAPERVTIEGYDDDAMEPFLTRDGAYLLFNNRNDPSVDTNLHWARRMDDLTFAYMGEISGAAAAWIGLCVTRSDSQENLPVSRPFYMGFTPWPYDFTDKAVQATYTSINDHADLILHHMDTGIPWQEALDGTPYPPPVLAAIEERVQQRRPGQKVYLSITPNALADRNRIADYWADEEHLSLPDHWAGRTFDDSHVITAFLNHARFMIEQFDPDYFAYGIEVTCTNRGTEDEAFLSLLRFAQQVYPTLKAAYPDLPIFLTICATSLELDDPAVLQAANQQIIRYSDYIGLSIYPYLLSPGVIELTGEADPTQLPDDLFSRWADLDPAKPFAITETDYIAEDLVVDKPGIAIRGTPAGQSAYLERLLQAAHDLEAEFVIWFVVRDYDAGVRAMETAGIPTASALIWRDTGLLDGEGAPRPALAIWDTWLNLPRNRS
jgi:hypothetical protein